jgi:hypothetical protein
MPESGCSSNVIPRLAGFLLPQIMQLQWDAGERLLAGKLSDGIEIIFPLFKICFK